MINKQNDVLISALKSQINKTKEDKDNRQILIEVKKSQEVINQLASKKRGARTVSLV